MGRNYVESRQERNEVTKVTIDGLCVIVSIEATSENAYGAAIANALAKVSEAHFRVPGVTRFEHNERQFVPANAAAKSSIGTSYFTFICDNQQTVQKLLDYLNK